jgi:hypothetical protein
MRARVMLTSPAWLTRRSSSAARTRTAALRRRGLRRAIGGSGAGSASVAKRDQSIDARPAAASARAPRQPRPPPAPAGSARPAGRLGRLNGGTDAGSAGAGQTPPPAPGLRRHGLRHHRGWRGGRARRPCAAPRRPAAMASARPSKGSTSAGATVSRRPGARSAVSSRCAISPRRMAPATRAPPLKVCSVRMQAEGASPSPGLSASRAAAPAAAAAALRLLPRRSGTDRRRWRRGRCPRRRRKRLRAARGLGIEGTSRAPGTQASFAS